MKFKLTLNRLKTTSCKSLKSGIAFILAIMMVVTMFASFELGIPTLKADAAASQTDSQDISEYQKKEFTRIQNEIFGLNNTGTNRATPSVIANKTVVEGNKYFNWTDTSADTSISKWSGGTSTASKVNNKIIAGVSYTVYNVTSADQFRYALEQTQYSGNYCINLMCDIDMNGNNGKKWTPIMPQTQTQTRYQNQRVYIEGNGHTIYNLKCVAAGDADSEGVGLFSYAPYYFVCKNLGFRSSMLLSTIDLSDGESRGGQCGLLCAYVGRKICVENVHSVGAYIQTSDEVGADGKTGSNGAGGLIGRKQNNFGYTSYDQSPGDNFIKNCSVEDNIIYGGNHLGGISSYIGCDIVSTNSKYDASYPTNAMQLATTSIDSSYGTYPWIIENTYSTGCTIFSTGADSGAFISCGTGIISRNCYTNNTIYAQKNTGGFIGRVATYEPAFMTDDGGKVDVCCSFDSCYSTGVVEGSVAMGGFVGLDMGGARSYTSIENGAGAVNEETSEGFAVYKDCFSTAMVGMDYAGKYCGGFIGMDDNYYGYNSSGKYGTIKVDDQAKKGDGSWYINCYSAGEVGNILTITDKEKAKEQEANYFADPSMGNKNHATNEDAVGSLDYYPTGGFAGILSIDLYKNIYNKNNPTTGMGNFFNCYYDMQTTAMREMAVGFCNLTVSSSSENKTSASETFELPGVKGVYTETSEVKNVPGLTDMPVTLASTEYKMGTSGNAWNYVDQYYPQQTVFMTGDTKLDDITTAEESNLTLDGVKIAGQEERGTVDLTKSVFYIKDSNPQKADILSNGTYPADWSKPVLSLSSVQETEGSNGIVKPRVTVLKSESKIPSAQLSEIVKAYRFCQAATSTVLLDHWDVTMNTLTGSIGYDSQWVPGYQSNAMKPSENKVEINGEMVNEYSIEYTGLAADSYEFKIQEGTTWAYNYGKDKFNGSNCQLDVEKDNSRVVIKFAYSGLKSDNYYIKAYIYEPGVDYSIAGNEPIEKVFHKLPDPETYQVTKYTLAGDFGSEYPYWKETAANGIVMDHDGYNEQYQSHTYSKTLTGLSAGDYYQFKITDGNGWAVNYGKAGVSGGSNMTFKLYDTTDINILFVEETKLCYITAADSKLIYDIETGTSQVVFNGVSVLTSNPVFFGYKWSDDTSAGGRKDLGGACEQGRMEYNEELGYWQKKCIIEGTEYFNKSYGYKIIENALDVGTNRQFTIDTLHDGITSAEIIFNYDPTKEDESRMWVTCPDTENFRILQYCKADTYYVAGVTELTGFNWTCEDQNIMRLDPVTGLYKLTFDSFIKDGEIVPALEKGKYEFKVVADSWDTGIDFGAAEGANYSFELTESASKVTIYFDPVSNADVKIYCSTDPSSALKRNEYVVTASRNLSACMGLDTGVSWDKLKPVMSYNRTTDKYELWINNVPANDKEPINSETVVEPNYSYAYKIIKKGVDSGDNILFSLNGNPGSDFYDILISFDENKKTDKFEEKCSVAVYPHSDNPHDVSQETPLGDVLNNDPQPLFYSVLGDKSLTGSNWGVSTGTSEERLAAAKDGLMAWDDSQHIYKLVKPFKVEGIPSEGNSQSYAFKVVGNGTWDSGVDYGDGSENEVITLSTPAGQNPVCYVYITFDPATKKIDYYTENEENIKVDYVYEIDESAFEWYICGVGKLFNNNLVNNSKPEVYDTVRDITSKFTFTYGYNSEERGLTIDYNTERNDADKFYASDKFDLSYTVNDKYTEENGDVTDRQTLINGEFDSDVITLKAKAIVDDNYTGVESSDLLAQFYVDRFAPGKQWLTIETIGYGYSNDYLNWKQDYLHYMEYCDKVENYNLVWEFTLNYCTKYIYKSKNVDESTLIEFLEYRKSLANDGLYDEIVRNVTLNLNSSSFTQGDLLVLKSEKEDMESKNWHVNPGAKPEIGSQCVIGARDLRLIPASYLEAGVDASVNVLQSKSDYYGVNAKNAVSFDNSAESLKTDGYKFSATVTDTVSYANGKTESRTPKTYENINDISFGYYNFAVTAAYLTTDKIGLGIYNNVYSKQEVTKYDESKIRDEDSVEERESASGANGAYYAMSSAYSQTAGYTDGGSRTSAKDTLKIGEFVNQSLIGVTRYNNPGDNSNAVADSGQRSQTLVKVFHVDVDEDGNKIASTPVYFNSDANSTTEYAVNYKKWTAQQNFTAEDTGIYEVRFYWTLSDGRYLQDSKYVNISVIEPGLTTSVDVEYDTAGENTLTYTITYTNQRTDILLNFALLDILPFNGDIRNIDGSGNAIYTSANDTKFTLKSIALSQTGESDIRNVYFSTSTDVQKYMIAGDGETKVMNPNAAENLKLSSNGEIKADGWSTPTAQDLVNTPYDPEISKFNDGVYDLEVEGITAVAISGIQLAQGQSVQMKLVLEYTGVASDLYANNSFYYVESALDSSQGVSSGVSDALQTAIISRDVSGFSWFDSNGNGAIDNDEPKLRNVRVKLYQYDAYAPEGQKYIDTGLETTTDKDGRYVFANVPSATYAVRFMAPESRVVYINDSNNALAFSKLSQTLVYSETQENCDDRTLETGVTTHNISKGIDTTPDAEENDKIYIFSTPNFYVPSDYSVYTMTNQTAGKNAVWNKFQYSRVFLNAGFNLKNYYSLSLDHTNALGDPLYGVKYKLLYLNEADNTWYPVYYSTISSGENETLEIKCMSSDLKTEADLTNGNIQYIFSTDASGILQFPNLLNGKYRLYQITDNDGFITDGYIGFERDYLEFDLPNKVLKSEFDNKSIDGTYYQSLSDDSKIANISKSVDKNNLFEDVNDTENYYFRNTNLSIENKLYSISVTKQCYDEETQEYLPLQGASFRLERKENNEWVTVSDGEESEKTTDSSGVISFANLLPGSYRLVETKTPDGYLKLQNPIECIELPYAVTGTSYTDEENYTDISNADYELAVNNKNLLKKVSGKSYYGHVGMTVINQNSQFILPTTGFNGLFITVAFGIVAFAGAITLFILSKKRKGKGKNSTINQ